MSDSKIKVRIGIDPDLKKSGVAIIYIEPFKTQAIQTLENLEFFKLLKLLKTTIDTHTFQNVTVFVEAGWLNKKSNYHSAFNKEIAGRIGKNVGENHAVGKLIEEYCIHNQITYKLVKPTTKKWDAKLFKQITKWDGRTNAETRDAVRTAWL